MVNNEHIRITAIICLTAIALCICGVWGFLCVQKGELAPIPSFVIEIASGGILILSGVARKPQEKKPVRRQPRKKPTVRRNESN